MEPSCGACQQGMAKLKRCDKCAWLVSPAGPARTKHIPALSGSTGGAGASTKATEGARALTAAKAATDGKRAVTAAKAATDGKRAVTAAKAATERKRKRAVTAAKRKVWKPGQKARQKQTPPAQLRWSSSSSGKVPDSDRSDRA